MNLITLAFSLILILGLFFMGNIVQAIRKLIRVVVDYSLLFLSLFGVRIQGERTVKTSAKFKEVYKGIKLVKMSNKNLKQKTSVDYIYLSVFLITLLLVALNLSVVSGNAISNWLFVIIEPLRIVPTRADMNVFYTAALFSVLSFSLTKVLQRWKDTKQYRIEKKEMKLKMKAIALMSSKELLDGARKKDIENKKELQ